MTEAEKKLRKQYTKERKRVQKIIKNASIDVAIPKLKELTTGEIKTGLKQLKKIHSREKIYNASDLRSTKTREEADEEYFDDEEGGRYSDSDIVTFDLFIDATDKFLENFDSASKDDPAGARIMLQFYEDMFESRPKDMTEEQFKRKFGTWLEGAYREDKYGAAEFYNDEYARKYIMQFLPYMGDYFRKKFNEINENYGDFYLPAEDL